MVALNGGRVQVGQSYRLPETGEEVGVVNFFNLTEEFLNGDRHPDEYQFVCRPFDGLRNLIWQFRIKS